MLGIGLLYNDCSKPRNGPILTPSVMFGPFKFSSHCSMLSLIIIIYFYYIKVILQNKNICSCLKLCLKILNEHYLKVAYQDKLT